MNNFKLIKRYAACLMAFSLLSCSDVTNDVDQDQNTLLRIENFNLDRLEIFPGETLGIAWDSSDAPIFEFDAVIYLSADDDISVEDIKVFDEACSFDAGSRCEADREVNADCLYTSENQFTCRQNDALLSDNNLDPLFDVLPKDAFVILELCDGSNCDRQNRPLTFR